MSNADIINELAGIVVGPRLDLIRYNSAIQSNR